MLEELLVELYVAAMEESIARPGSKF